MNRPTKRQVDDSLDVIDKGDMLDRSPAALVLAAEVRALREIIARVEELPAVWRDEEFAGDERRGHCEESALSGNDCARDVEKALRGGA